ncbi:competence protein ComK [Bacillus benzoevorans]|uniref:Competence protein ComK n=1 Tax=Bacillus benzoevorans TaxID=1456 RepID=A0A7X0HME1_9BACI|nr:competence protein ComK [Bacillus benzoevorans]MBB6443490.1 competence protein ComK [Bacillus benzoevorans]
MNSIEKNRECTINARTMMILPIHYGNQIYSRIIQLDGEFLSPYKPTCIIKMNCLDNGSSFEGRVSSSRHILGCYQKVPIIINSENQMYYFPTASPEQADCIWINPIYIDKIKPLDKKIISVLFKNKQIMKIPVSSHTFKKQMHKTMELRDKKTQKNRENEGNIFYFEQNNARNSERISERITSSTYGSFSEAVRKHEGMKPYK